MIKELSPGNFHSTTLLKKINELVQAYNRIEEKYLDHTHKVSLDSGELGTSKPYNDV